VLRGVEDLASVTICVSPTSGALVGRCVGTIFASGIFFVVVVLSVSERSPFVFECGIGKSAVRGGMSALVFLVVFNQRKANDLTRNTIAK
jgi:hypothetical protein